MTTGTAYWIYAKHLDKTRPTDSPSRVVTEKTYIPRHKDW